jgi:hypothetical protein
MPEFVERLEEYTAAPAAVADGIHPLLLVRHRVHQACFGALAENLLGFLASELTSQTIFDYVVTESAKVKADLNATCRSGILAIGRVRVDVLAVPAGTGGDGKIVLRIKHLDYFFVGQNLASVFYCLLNRQHPQTL